MKNTKSIAVILLTVLVGALLPSSSPASGATAASYQRVSGLNLNIVDGTSTLQPPKVMATIFNTNVCPAYIFYGVRGSGEGYAYREVKKLDLVAKTGNIPQRNRYADLKDPDEALFTYDSKKRLKPSDSYGIGTTLGKVFTRLKATSPFKGKIKSSAPYASDKDTDGGYQAPPVDALFQGASGAQTYIGSMFVNGIFTNMSSMFFITKACPNSKLIVSGYSQGAFIVSASVTNLRDYSWGPATLKSVKAIALLADPAQPSTGLVSAMDELSSDENLMNLASTVNVAVASRALLEYGKAALRKDRSAMARHSDTLNMCNSVAAMLTLAKELKNKIGATRLTVFANAKTVRPGSTEAMPIRSFQRTDKDDAVSATGSVLDTFLVSLSKAAVNFDFKAIEAAVAKAKSSADVHSSYGKAWSTWAADKIVPWLANLKTLK